MRDCRNKEIATGDTVVYPICQGSSSARLIVGTVLEFYGEDQVRVAREFESNRLPPRNSRALVRANRVMKVELP